MAKKKTKKTGVGPVISIRQRSAGGRGTKRGRDARTGEFTTVGEARRHPQTHRVESVPKPGYGETKKNKK